MPTVYLQDGIMRMYVHFQHDEKVKAAPKTSNNASGSKFNNFEQRNDNIDSDMQDKFLNELNNL